VIFVGIDDTDTLESRGTNQLAKAMARSVAGDYGCRRIVRHQLLDDPRVPYTSKNGSASLVFEYIGMSQSELPLSDLANSLLEVMRADFIAGSDPGFCIATTISAEVIEFAHRCQRDLVDQHVARKIAAAHGIFLEGLGGTQDGVIGALAAVGLAASNDGGRVVQWGQWPDDLSGPQPIEALHRREIQIQQLDSREPVTSGHIDVGKHLRPNWVAGRCVLYVIKQVPSASDQPEWQAVRMP